MQHSPEFIALQARNKNRHCQRPGKEASKALLRELHRHKMMGKFFRRQERGVTRTEQALASGRRIRPNMSDRTLKARYGKREK